MASVGTVVEEVAGELRAAVERELQSLRRAVPEGGLAAIEERLQALRTAWDQMVLGAVGPKGYVATFAGIEAFRNLWDTEAQRWRMAEAIAHLRAGYQSGRWHSLRRRLIAHSRQAA